MLSDGLKEDIIELTNKLKKVNLEIEDMKSHLSDYEKSKDQTIRSQLSLLEQLHIELTSLRLKLKNLENLTIDGFTDSEILDLREILDKVSFIFFTFIDQ